MCSRNDRPAKPKIASIDLDAIPAELRGFPSWVHWVWEWAAGDRWAKVPCLRGPQLLDGYTPSKANDPSTWGPFWADELDGGGIAAAYLYADEFRRGQYGLGFVLSSDDPFACIDLDDCRDPRTGALTAEAQAIVRRFATYTEVSPSGRGVKLFLKGKKPGTECRLGKVEIYDDVRFLTVTGRLLAGCPAVIEDRQEVLTAFYGEVFAERLKAKATQKQPEPGQQPLRPSSLSDRDVIDRASRAKNGAAFDRLWSGDASRYSSRSEADLALAGMLAFWCGNDSSRIESLMRQSGLRRQKWQRGDYLRRTISRALAGRSSFFGDPYFRAEEAAPAVPEAARCPHPILSKEENAGSARPDPLEGLPAPPPASACPRAPSDVLAHKDNPGKFRAVNQSCDCWSCPACRTRRAVAWAEHLIACAESDVASGRTLHALECTQQALRSRVSPALRRRDANRVALEAGATTQAVVYSLPAGQEPLEGSSPISLSEFGLRLVEWAKTVRTGCGYRKKKTHPASPSKGWRMPPDERTSTWRKVAELDTKSPELVVKALRECGIAAGQREESPSWPSLVWMVEWTCAPEQVRDVIEKLAALDDAEPRRQPRKREAEEIPW